MLDGQLHDEKKRRTRNRILFEEILASILTARKEDRLLNFRRFVKKTWKYDQREIDTASGNWNRKTLQILHCYHLVVLGTTFFQQQTLKQGEKDNIHCNVSTKTVSKLYKLIESANHLCIFIAITKYMDDLPWRRPSSKPRKAALRR